MAQLPTSMDMAAAVGMVLIKDAMTMTTDHLTAVEVAVEVTVTAAQVVLRAAIVNR